MSQLNGDRSRGNKKGSQIPIVTTYDLMGNPLDDLLSEEERPFKRRACPEIKVEVLNNSIPALIDTGSEVSAISDDLFRELVGTDPNTPVLPIRKSFLLCANKRKSNPITKQALLTMICQEYKFEVACLVVNNLVRPIILGTDWLSENNIIIDFRNRELRFESESGHNQNHSFPLCAIISNNDTVRERACASESDLELAVGIIDHLSLEERDQLLRILCKYREVFSNEPGLAKNFVQRIRLSDETPFRQKSYPIPHAYEAQVEEQIRNMLANGIIEKSSSPYVNPLVVVKKKDGHVRLCLDARKLNSLTIPEREEPPHIDELFRKFNGVTYFSTTDFTSAYWQMSLHPLDRKYTAFLYKSISYVFTRVPYGLKNSGAALIRCIDRALSVQIRPFATVYVDDLLITSKHFSDHLAHLEIILRKLRGANMTLNLAKSQFCRQRVPFIGHILTPEGFQADPEKIRAIQEFPAPGNIRQLRGFLGMCNYYAKFTERYAYLTVPLLSLLKKNAKWEWTRSLQASFDAVKDAFLKNVTLKYPDFTRPLYLQTDSSNHGLGAVLFQKDSVGRENVLAFLSRTLKGPELAYTTTEKEMLAIVWALQKLRTTILGNKNYFINFSTYLRAHTESQN